MLENISYIFNLACPASPVHYQYDPVKTVRTNVLGTFHCLQMAEKHGAQLFQASTSEVYGTMKTYLRLPDSNLELKNRSVWRMLNLVI